MLVETNLTVAYQREGAIRKRWALYQIRSRKANSEECCEILYTHGIHIAAQSQGYCLSISFLNRTMSHTGKCAQ